MRRRAAAARALARLQQEHLTGEIITDKNRLIERVALLEEDKLLLARILDKMELTARRNVPSATQFLNSRERALAERLILAAGSPEHEFEGGEERAVLKFLLDYPCDFSPVCYIRAEFSTMYRLDHRDLLGALMGAGIKRETVGDINVGEGSAEFAVLADIVPYLMSNLDSAGRAKLSLSVISKQELSAAADDFDLRRVTVSSLRLDSVLAAAFKLSRTRALELVNAGRVSLDHIECLKPDKPVGEGSVISVRGHGRAVVVGVGGRSRKGRTILEVKIYGR